MPHWRSAECHVTYQPLLPCPHPHRWLVGAHPVPVSLPEHVYIYIHAHIMSVRVVTENTAKSYCKNHNIMIHTHVM